MLDDVEAVVLVGGKGTRLRPLTLSAPKPMLPTAGVPFLAHLLSRIRAAGVRRVVLGTSYMAETFAKDFGDGAELGLELVYVVEDEPLGTGGGIRNVAEHLTADERARLQRRRAVRHRPRRASSAPTGRRGATSPCTSCEVPDPRAFGCVPTDASGRVHRVPREDRGPAHRPDQRRLLRLPPLRDRLHPDGPAGLGRAGDVPRAAHGGRAGVRARRQRLLARHGHARPTSSTARPTSCAASRRRRRCPVRPARRSSSTAPRSPPTRWCSAAATVGRGVTVGAGARVDGSMLFDGAVVAPGAVVEQSVVGAGARIEEGATLRDTVVGDRAVVGAHCELRRGMRVWPDIVLPPHGVRFSPDV